MRLLLVETPMRRDESLLREQFAEAVDEAVGRAQALALASMRHAVEERGGVVADASQASVDDPITEDTARELRAAYGTDLLLRFRITDYGITPKAWRKAYIAFEVVSTLAIAGIAYAYPKTRPVAGAYLVEEGIEETLEGYAGFWALNKCCRPVRIQAELISLDTRETLWQGSATGLSHLHPARVVRKVSDEEADRQRARALDQAANKIAAESAEALAQDRGK